MTAMQITISGVAVPIQANSLSLPDAIEQRSVLTFTVDDPTGATPTGAHYTSGQPVAFTDDTGALRYTGVIDSTNEVKPGPASDTRLWTTIVCADNHWFADKRIIPASYTNQTAGFIFGDLITNYLAAEGITVGNVSDGPTLPAITFNYATCAACFDELATQAGFVWWIDAQKQAWFQARSAANAPWALTADVSGVVADALAGSLSVANGNPVYRNRQYLTNVTAQTATQTETRKGDGATTAFTLGYDVASAPTITLNGGAQTVGILNVDTGMQWYWNQGSNVITQDSSGTKLISTDTLSVTYIGQYQTVLLSEDPAAVTDRQMIEGSGTGQVEDVQAATQGSTLDQAFTTAAALLAEYAMIGRTLTFTTRRSGLLPGQLMTADIPAHNLSNAQMLIDTVSISDEDGVRLVYVVKAIEGPVLGDWTKFFLRLAGATPAATALINVGQQGTLTILESVSENWNWTESVTETVYACPVFPWTLPVTLC